jgi:hypothetical protein
MNGLLPYNRPRVPKLLSVRSVGLSLIPLLLPWPAPATQATAFAQALRRRYQGQPGRWPLLGLVFRQPQAGATSYHHTSLFQIQMAPRLDLTLGSRPVPAAPASLAPAPERQVVSTLPATANLVQQRIETLLYHLTARERRLDSVAAAGAAPQPQARATAPVGPPVPRVVRRATAEVAPNPQPSPTALPLPGRPGTQSPLDWPPAGTPPSPPAWPPAGTPPSPALNPGVVNHLADQVLQVLDRRMTAHRERLGRG